MRGRQRKGGKIRHGPDGRRRRFHDAGKRPHPSGRKKPRGQFSGKRGRHDPMVDGQPSPTKPRRKLITEEQQAMLDRTFTEMDAIEDAIRTRQREIQDQEADFRRLYNQLNASGRADYFRRVYDKFAAVYDYVMSSTGHFGAIREVLPIGRKFLRPPIMDITAGTYEVLRYALELMDMPKDIRVLLNQYRIIMENYPQTPIFEGGEHLKRIERAVESILPEFGRGYFNKGADCLVWANEISSEMSKKGKEKLKGHEIKHTSFNATELPEELEGKFMTVVCAQTFHLISLADKINLIKSIYRALKPGGYAIIVEEENFRISPNFDIRGVGIPLRAVACPVERKSDFISMFTRFEDKDGKPIGFKYTGIGSKMNVDKKPGHTMRSYIFRKPLKAEHLADAVTSIYDSQERRAAHNSQHMLRCAIAAAEYVDKNPDKMPVDHKDELIRVAAITGLMHDFVQTSHDIDGEHDLTTAYLIECIAGSEPEINNIDYRAVRLKLAEEHPEEELRIISDFLREYPEQISMISQIIQINEGSSEEILKTVDQMIENGRTAQALVCKALMYADKGKEDSGSSALIRRAQSVSGERAEKHDDIGALTESRPRHRFSDRDFRLLAFIGESMIRMSSDKPVQDLFVGAKELRQRKESERKVYGALVYYFEENHGWGEREIFDFLLNCGFPNMEKSKESIVENIIGEQKEGPKQTFADDAVRLVLSLAYLQSRDERLRDEGEAIKSRITDNDIKSILEASDIIELKKRFAAFFD
jgi:SAM-dependent methyltransferase